jgi:two-component system nitrate/nitrite response regulator NarL
VTTGLTAGALARAEGTAPRVLIIEDQRLLAEALRWSLERAGIAVPSVARTAAEAIEAVRLDPPQLVLVDVNLPDADGIDLGRELAAADTDLRMVALTADRDEALPGRAMAAGFHGFLTKDLSVSELTRAIVRTLEGEPVVRARRAAGSWSRGDAGGKDGVRSLTVRETEILRLLAAGATSKAVARELGISRHTVRSHVQGILHKLRVHSRLEAVAVAARAGVLAQRRTEANG